MSKPNLFTFEFISLCIITFLTLCNISIFYNFHLYLQHLGFEGKEAGIIIGLYSLSAMALYASASRHVRYDNAFTCMLAGVFILGGCGVSYLIVNSFWSLAMVRIASGAGIFLVMAACMVVLVENIPQEKTGIAFSLYSVALLSPYSIMPAISEIIADYVGAPTRLYMATASLLLPAAGCILIMQKRIRIQQPEPAHPSGENHGQRGGERKNIFRKPVVYIMLVNTAYFTIFSGLFFLFEGLGVQRGIENPGFFFTTQMGVMIAIRLLGGRFFDTFSKVALVSIALLVTGMGFALLLVVPDATWILPIAALFGLGMGLCVPPLNSLMYLVTEPKYRGYNANMMMLSLHFGMFTGPFVGAWVVDAGGYALFLRLGTLLAVGAAAFFFITNPAQYIHQRVRRK